VKIKREAAGDAQTPQIPRPNDPPKKTPAHPVPGFT